MRRLDSELYRAIEELLMQYSLNSKENAAELYTLVRSKIDYDPKIEKSLEEGDVDLFVKQTILMEALKL